MAVSCKCQRSRQQPSSRKYQRSRQMVVSRKRQRFRKTAISCKRHKQPSFIRIAHDSPAKNTQGRYSSICPDYTSFYHALSACFLLSPLNRFPANCRQGVTSSCLALFKSLSGGYFRPPVLRLSRQWPQAAFRPLVLHSCGPAVRKQFKFPFAARKRPPLHNSPKAVTESALPALCRPYSSPLLHNTDPAYPRTPPAESPGLPQDHSAMLPSQLASERYRASC